MPSEELVLVLSLWCACVPRGCPDQGNGSLAVTARRRWLSRVLNSGEPPQAGNGAGKSRRRCQ